MRRALAWAVAALAMGIAAAQPACAAAASPLKALIDDFDRFQRVRDPVSAGLEGDRAALERWPDDSPAAIAARRASLDGFRRRLEAIPAAPPDTEDGLNRAFLAQLLDDQLQGAGFDQEREPFSSDEGPFDTPDYVARATAIHDEADARAWLARLKALPGYYDVQIANARRGVRDGFVQPRATVEVVLAAARTRLAQPAEDSPLLIPVQQLPDAIPKDRQAALRAEALKIVRENVKPKEAAYVAMLQGEYLPSARSSLGARALPDGERYYAWLVRHYTTTTLTPDQVHALGLSEVSRIRAEMDAAIRQSGFKGSFADFLAFLRTDPRFYAKSRQELLDRASEIDKRVDDKLPGYFGTLPRLTFGVRPVPAEMEDGYTTGRYWQGSPESGIAAGYMVNTSHLDQRPLYELPALTLHESIPGHHLQIALAQERRDLPFFRRNANIDAYTEGWGLYAESLGEEMGIYRDAYERFGRLSYEMWRACRLVADTGIHWLGWTREQARACFVQNTALAPKNIDVELDRYISWPGQALAYKVGEIRLKALRRRAEAALGPRFDIRRFHDEVLLEGPLPLDLLEARVDRWIATEKARPAEGSGR
jgi:uncharacterized protein (DUF885 family)